MSSQTWLDILQLPAKGGRVPLSALRREELTVFLCAARLGARVEACGGGGAFEHPVECEICGGSGRTWSRDGLSLNDVGVMIASVF